MTADIFSIINEAKALISEGDRGQILLQKPNKPEGDRAGQKMNANPDPTGVISKGEAKGKKLLKKGKKVQESRAETGKGSKEGRKAIHTHDKKLHSNPKKSRVRVYDSITDALKRGYIGQIFSTKDADRLYVITKQKWGKDNEQIISGRSAKGFTPGSIPSSFSDVKKYAVRTMVRHAGGSKRGKEKYFKGKK